MRVEGISEMAMQFQLSQENYEVPFATKSGVLIRFVEMDRWIRVMIEVGEDTTSQQLREAAPLALEWRQRLLKWQGPWMGGGDNPFLEQLDGRQQNGESYRALSESINHRVATLIQEFAAYIREYDSVKHEFKTMSDFYLWRPASNPFSFEHARDILRALRLKDKDIEPQLRKALENAKSGLPPFEAQYPVSREKMIATLRRWRQNPKHKIREGIDLEAQKAPQG
ncbi:MAG: hypothetical protein WD906_07045 [Anaerolineales bacterium]